jgi:hypothetical protein
MENEATPAIDRTLTRLIGVIFADMRPKGGLNPAPWATCVLQMTSCLYVCQAGLGQAAKWVQPRTAR